MNVLKNRLVALNKVASMQRAVAPLVNKYFEENPVKRKSDGTLFKKQSDDIKKIINANNPDKLQAFVSCSEYSPSITFKTSYKTGDYGCDYVEEYFYIGRDFQPAPFYTYNDLVKCQDRLKKVSDKMQELRSEECKLKIILGRR